MIAVLQSLVLKTAIIVVTLNCCSAISDKIEKPIQDCSERISKMNVTIRNEVTQNSIRPATPVISWDNPPTCKQTKITGWQISIGKSRSSTIIERQLTDNNSFTFAKAEACQTYNVIIKIIFENGNVSSPTQTKYFQAECPDDFGIKSTVLLPISVIVVLLLIAIIIAVLLSRKRKQKEALEKESENYIDKRSLVVESRIPSNRLSSVNRNKVSYRSNVNAEIDLDCMPRPMNIRDSFDVGQVRMEFFLINNLSEKEAERLPRTSAQRPENKFKNRFLNTHPYDFNRVLLSPSEEYINASFIPGFSEKEKEYIAAQGPKNNTLNDFWQMILEQDVRLIAMVTSLYECGKKKCEKYWPDKGELGIYGDNTQIELLEETTSSFYTTRMFLASKAPNFKRMIQQFHFTAWPDFETPDQPEELIQFIEIVRRTAKQWNLSSPIVVHCSAGVGRTGTFIALDYLMQQVLITDLIDVPKTVRHLRRFRLSMVQSEAQYAFLYSCIGHYVKTRLNQIKE